jgi:hypothetical protein
VRAQQLRREKARAEAEAKAQMEAAEETATEAAAEVDGDEAEGTPADAPQTSREEAP